MRLFDTNIVDLLRPDLDNEAIHFVGLGGFDFQFSFGRVRAQNEQRVDFGLKGVTYTWEEGASDIPAWLLIDQVPVEVTLESPHALRITFRSGDWIRLHTEDVPYECQTFEWPRADDGAIVLEVY